MKIDQITAQEVLLVPTGPKFPYSEYSQPYTIIFLKQIPITDYKLQAVIYGPNLLTIPEKTVIYGL